MTLDRYILPITRNSKLPLRLRKKLGNLYKVRAEDFSQDIDGVAYQGNTALHMDHKIYLYGYHEAATIRLLRHLLSQTQNSTYMDIGTNSGFHILGTINSCAKAYGFEPNPYVFQEALRNMKANNLQDKVTISNFGLSDQESDLPFLFPEGNNLGVGKFTEDPTENSLKVRIGDNFCEENNLHPDVIKIDVEGHEGSVLRGLSRTLESSRPAVIFEYADDSRESFFEKEKRAALFGATYSYFGILRSREYPKLQAFDPNKKYENVLALPSEKHFLIR